MKRHDRLVPLSHDHHHALVEARRLRESATLDQEALVEAAGTFVRFFRGETIMHFRTEEELVFPLVVEGEAVPDLVLEALAQHDRIHARVQQVEDRLAAGSLQVGDVVGLGELLHEHVRFEERQLFPFIERNADPERLQALAFPTT